MLPVLAMAMKHPRRNINLSAAAYRFAKDHVIVDWLTHHDRDRRIEPQSFQEYEAEPGPMAEIVKGCDALRRERCDLASQPRLLAGIKGQ